jgi:outer membrane protein OmpA-like peptidoglycan-associated protein
MEPRFTLAVLATAVCLSQPAVGQRVTYTDPDAPATHEAARAALANAHVLDIVGVTLSIDGLLRDLGAKVVGNEIRISLSADVLFDFDSAALRPDATTQLVKVAQVIKGYPRSPVLIEGHTDSKGADAYNLALSQKRAASVKQWLQQSGGIAAAKMTTRGLGETTPVAPNEKPDGTDDPAGRQKNRRVEITLTKS